MKPTDVAELFGLAALWGASFLLMRMGAAEFGPVALAAIRVTGAALLLVPLLAWRGQLATMRRHWRPILVVGLTNTALPFLCFSYAALSITAGMSSIFNAASPLFSALIARLWLGDRLTPARIAGLAIGFGGVLGMAWTNGSFKAGGSGLAILACLVATLSYGFSPNYTKRRLQGVATLASRRRSKVAATLMLSVPAICGGGTKRTRPMAERCVSRRRHRVAHPVLRLIANVGPRTRCGHLPDPGVRWSGLDVLGERVTLAMASLHVILPHALATSLKPRCALRATSG